MARPSRTRLKRPIFWLKCFLKIQHVPSLSNHSPLRRGPHALYLKSIFEQGKLKECLQKQTFRIHKNSALSTEHSIKKDDYEEFFKTLGNRFLAGGDYNAKHTIWGSRLMSPKRRQLKLAIDSLNWNVFSTGEPTTKPLFSLIFS